jgi:hypothetical protein
MSSPEHGLALSDTAIDILRWLDMSGVPAKEVLNTLTIPPIRYNNNGRIPLDYYWVSKSIDVRGMPDISLTLVCSYGYSEAVLKVMFQVSLDGQAWFDIPESVFTVADGQRMVTSCDQSFFVNIFLRTNFIRVLVTFPGASPPELPEVELHGHIVAGEA